MSLMCVVRGTVHLRAARREPYMNRVCRDESSRVKLSLLMCGGAIYARVDICARNQ